MEKTTSKLTVIFEDPFWIGLYERQTGSRYEVCRIVFGAEPKNYDVAEFMRKNWRRLKFSPAVSSDALNERRVNPKRMQRYEAKKHQHQGAAGDKPCKRAKQAGEEKAFQRTERGRKTKEASDTSGKEKTKAQGPLTSVLNSFICSALSGFLSAL